VFRSTNANLQIQPIEPGAGDPGPGTGSVEFGHSNAVLHVKIPTSRAGCVEEERVRRLSGPFRSTALLTSNDAPKICSSGAVAHEPNGKANAIPGALRIRRQTSITLSSGRDVQAVFCRRRHQLRRLARGGDQPGD